MKTKILALIILASCLTLPALRADSFSIGIGIGGHDHWRHRHGRFYGHKAYHHPLIIETRPVVVEERIVQTSPPADEIPYGFLSGGRVKSPWSDFSMSVGGKTSGEVIYDPNTGQAFRVP
ncbi:MAG: hypothetical protein V1746_02055 [bacterium]